MSEILNARESMRLSLQEVLNLSEFIMDGNDLKVLRRRVIILLVTLTEISREELCSIKIKDIKVCNGQDIVEIRRREGQDRYIAIPDVCKISIDKYIKARGLSYNDGEVYLLTKDTLRTDYSKCTIMSAQSIYKILKETSDKIGIYYVGRLDLQNVEFDQLYKAVKVNIDREILQLSKEFYTNEEIETFDHNSLETISFNKSNIIEKSESIKNKKNDNYCCGFRENKNDIQKDCTNRLMDFNEHIATLDEDVFDDPLKMLRWLDKNI